MSRRAARSAIRSSSATPAGRAGRSDWKLVGPVAPTSGGTCAGLDWSSAATVDSGTISILGDGTYATPSSTPTGTGCYSYVEQLTGAAFAGPATSLAGSAGETELVAEPADPPPPAASVAPPGNGNAGTPDPVAQSSPGNSPGSRAGRSNHDRQDRQRQGNRSRQATHVHVDGHELRARHGDRPDGQRHPGLEDAVRVREHREWNLHTAPADDLRARSAPRRHNGDDHDPRRPDRAGTAINNAHVSSTQTTMAADAVTSATASTAWWRR